MTKPLEKLPLYVSAASAIIVLVACITIGAPLYWMATWVSLTIALFYALGHLVRILIVSAVFPPEDEELSEFGLAVYEDGGEVEEANDEENDGENGEEAEDGTEDDDGYEDYEDAELEPVEDAFLDR